MTAEPVPPPAVLAPTAIPDVVAFGLIVAPDAPKHRSVRKLHELLMVCSAGAKRLEREGMLVRLCAWVSHGPTPAPLPDVTEREALQVTRLRLLLRALEGVPAFAAELCAIVRVGLAEHSAESFFARLGIPGDRGLFSETVDRLSRRLMPQPVDEEDLTSLLARMFPKSRDLWWIRVLPARLVERLVELLRRADGDGLPGGTRGTLGNVPLGHVSVVGDDKGEVSSKAEPVISAWAPLRVALLDAIQLLASRTSSAGLSDVIRARSPAGRLRDSPFFRLPRIIDALLATPRRDIEQITDWADDMRAVLAECSGTCEAVLARLEKAGVSVDVVYRLELIERSIDRIELLIGHLLLRSPVQRAERAAALLALLLEERRRERSLVDILRTNTHMLARKIIERAGQTGEHYITVTRGEYFKMIASAGGGGLLTGVTAALKVKIGSMHRALLQDGLLASANYAGSFLIMQLLGFTLATKQPSMTGAALAGAVKKGGDRQAMVTVIARVFRSQLAAAFGNVMMVIPSAYAIDWWWQRQHGTHFLTPEYSDKVLTSLHPTSSGTIPFAMFTGVILWASSLCAGWLENWATYRRLPEAIAEHRIGRIIGTRITGWASRVFARNIAGFGGNVSIGFLLGLTPSLGQFAGVPVEVRHVTLSTGSATFAALATDLPPLEVPGLRAAAAGIGVILFCNLTVSFTLALVVAFRAREVGFREVMRLLGAVLIGFLKSPLRFFLPVERGATPTQH